VVAAEWARGGDTNGASPAWLTLEVAAVGVALLVAWHDQHRLRLVPLLVLTAVYAVAVVLIHEANAISGDTDLRVYAAQGNLLLDGDYPHSEYPVGAVLLFAGDALLGGTDVLLTHALLMIPFLLLTVGAVWALRTAWSSWLAALIAVWPANLFFVHLRFDIVVAALLAAGLVLARRERWGGAGAVLGVGAAVKWSPALACVVLVVWLLASGRGRAALRHAAAFVVAVAVVNLPFLVWDPSDVIAAYTTQSTRGMIAESLPFLPLRSLGLAEVSPSGHIWEEAVVPAWADGAALAAQIALLAVVVAVAVRARGRLDSAVACAALAPAVFLLTNRVFSPQFALVVLAAWAVAIALLARSAREQLALGTAAMVALYANAVVIPGFADPFLPWSVLFFTVAVALTGWLLWSSDRRRRVDSYRMTGTVPPSTDHAAPVT
jgi:glycosyl transferase family 87